MALIPNEVILFPENHKSHQLTQDEIIQTISKQHEGDRTHFEDPGMTDSVVNVDREEQLLHLQGWYLFITHSEKLDREQERA